MKMASIVWVMGFPTVQAILRSVADAAILKAGVYAIGSSFLVIVIWYVTWTGNRLSI